MWRTGRSSFVKLHHLPKSPCQLEELYANWHGDLDRLAGGLESAGRLIDAEDVDVAGVLIGGEHPASGGVDSEIARVLASRRFSAKEGELAGFLIYAKHGY